MNIPRQMLGLPLVAACLLLMPPAHAQGPGQPASGSAAAADAASIQQQASDAYARALEAALHCNRGAYAREIQLLESLNTRMAEVSANAAAAARVARRVPAEFGGPAQGGDGEVARAERVVATLLANARGLVFNCGGQTTEAAPPPEQPVADDAADQATGPVPTGKGDDFYFPTPTADNPNPTGWIRARGPETEYDLWRKYGHMPIPEEDPGAEEKTPEMGGTESADMQPPPRSPSPGAASQDRPPTERTDEKEGRASPGARPDRPRKQEKESSDTPQGDPD
ncbi:MAG: hypothetical protein ACLGHC_06995 [Alphaproteobacteria bacterium]